MIMAVFSRKVSFSVGKTEGCVNRTMVINVNGFHRHLPFGERFSLPGPAVAGKAGPALPGSAPQRRALAFDRLFW
jgi:hypothetical protein